MGAADFAGQAIESNQLVVQGDDGTTTTTTSSESTMLDIARVLRFAFFGLVLQPPLESFLLFIFGWCLTPTPEPFTATTGIKVAIDQFIQEAPIFTILIFFFLGMLEGKSVKEVQTQLEADYQDTMVANCKLSCCL